MKILEIYKYICQVFAKKLGHILKFTEYTGTMQILAWNSVYLFEVSRGPTSRMPF